MAQSPFTIHLAPLCYRIAIPTLVWLLPFGPEFGFRAIAILSLIATGVLLYYFLRRTGISHEIGLASLLLLYSLQSLSSFNIWDFWLTDSAAFAFVVGMYLTTIKRRTLSFGVLLLIGSLVKESVLLCIIVFLTYLPREGRSKWIRNGLFTIAPTLVLYFLFRIVYSPEGGVPFQVSWILQILLLRVTENPLEQATIMSLGTWSILVITLAVIGLLQKNDLRTPFLLFLLADYAQLLFATNTDRLLVLGFVPMIAWSAYGMEKISNKLRIPRSLIFLICIVPFVVPFNLSLFPLPGEIWSVNMPTPTIQLITVVTWYAVILLAHLIVRLRDRKLRESERNEPREQTRILTNDSSAP